MPRQSSIESIVRQCRALSDQSGVLDPAVVGALKSKARELVDSDSPVARIVSPSWLEQVSAVSQADPSAGWLLATCTAVGAIVREVDAEISPGGSLTDPWMAGVIAGTGLVAVRSDDAGPEVTGEWRFASGYDTAEALLLGAVDENQRWRGVIVSREQTRVVQHWDGLGLRATSSHAIALADTEGETPRVLPPEAFDKINLPIVLNIGIGAVAVGILRFLRDWVLEAGNAGSTQSEFDRCVLRAAIYERHFFSGAERCMESSLAVVEMRALIAQMIGLAKTFVVALHACAGGRAAWNRHELVIALRDTFTVSCHIAASRDRLVEYMAVAHDSLRGHA